MNDTNDAVETERTRAAWDRIADGYDEHVTSGHMWLARQALDRAGLEAGMRFLDVAAGTGALTVPALRRGARVLAVDLSPQMIARLEARARRDGLLELEGRVMDAHALDLPDGSFDLSGSQFGVMLLPDLPRALCEMVRVTRCGGRVMVAAYGPPAQVEFIRFFVGAVRSVVPDFEGLPQDPPPLPFQLADPSRLAAEMTRAGLRDLQIDTVTETLQFASGDSLWHWLLNSNPIPGMLLAELTEAERGAVRRSLERRVRERAGSSPFAALTNPVHIGVGTV